MLEIVNENGINANNYFSALIVLSAQNLRKKRKKKTRNKNKKKIRIRSGGYGCDIANSNSTKQNSAAFKLNLNCFPMHTNECRLSVSFSADKLKANYRISPCFVRYPICLCFSVPRPYREYTVSYIYSSCALDGQACAR